MNNVINLNQFRKKKNRADKEKLAQENRAKFGQTKTEKNTAKAEKAELESHLDQHKNDPTKD